MRKIICNSCGANEFRIVDGYRVCRFCGTKYALSSSDIIGKSSIALYDDISRLLKKCSDDPANARKYANLILDIDPDNTEVIRYLE